MKEKEVYTDLATLLKKIKEYNPNADVKLITKAYNFAVEKHKGQKRETGEDYIVHPIEVAKILIDMRADSATICAALLHDTVEDSGVKVKEIIDEFSEEIADLVQGLTKIDKVNFETKEDYNAENIRKVLLATTKDIRVMLIKLADRLHNMKTLKIFKPEKQKRIATETLNIYAPIAYKLGIQKVKGELEDLALRYLEPQVYKYLADKINEKREERERKTQEIIQFLLDQLALQDVKADITGRAKYFYSIYRKMKQKHKDFSEIYDLIGIRIITQNIPDCYSALGVVHKLYKPIPRKFKDYLAVPKANGYQSLHTAVVTNTGKILEVQIRTEEMQSFAEEGVAAHWRYKGTDRDKYFDRKINWLKQLLNWRTTDDAKEFIETLKFDLFENEIVVFTPKGDPISLPESSTPIDFAYEVHSDVGENCSGSEVNGKMVPLDYILQSGDIVNIITSNKAKPNRQWLTFIKTSKARSKIKQALKIDDKPIKKKRVKIVEKTENVLDYIIADSKKSMKISKCCSPKIGDKIKGFLTKDGKITIHKEDCINIHTLDSNKEVKLKWKKFEKKDFIKIKCVVHDRVGILADILDVIRKTNLNLGNVISKVHKGRFVVTFSIETKDEHLVQQIIDNIKMIKDVVDAKVEKN
ncbi:RelA/SpoT family protein [Nanoarchaeota archaeon]